MQYDHVLKKFNFDLLIPRVGCGGGGSAGKIFATMLLHFVIPFFMQYDLVLKMLIFDPIPKVGAGGGESMWPNYLLPCCCIRDSLSAHPQGSWGSGGGVCVQNIFYHVAEFRDSL